MRDEDQQIVEDQRRFEFYWNDIKAALGPRFGGATYRPQGVPGAEARPVLIIAIVDPTDEDLEQAERLAWRDVDFQFTRVPLSEEALNRVRERIGERMSTGLVEGRLSAASYGIGVGCTLGVFDIWVCPRDLAFVDECVADAPPGTVHIHLQPGHT